MKNACKPVNRLERACREVLQRKDLRPTAQLLGTRRRDLFWVLSAILLGGMIFSVLGSLYLSLSCIGLLDDPVAEAVEDRRWGSSSNSVPATSAAFLGGKIWLGDSLGQLHSFNPTTGLFSTGKSLPLGPLVELESGKGILGLLSARGEVHLVHPDTGARSALFSTEESFRVGMDYWVDAATWQGLVLVGTAGKGIGVYDPEGHQWLPPINEENEIIQSNQVFGVVSREDRLFIGTSRGIHLFRRKEPRKAPPSKEEEVQFFARQGITRLVASGERIWALAQDPPAILLLDGECQLQHSRIFSCQERDLGDLKEAIGFGGSLWLYGKRLYLYDLEKLDFRSAPGELGLVQIRRMQKGGDVLWVLSRDRIYTVTAEGGQFRTHSIQRPLGMTSLFPAAGGAYLLYQDGGVHWIARELGEDRSVLSASTLATPAPEFLCARRQGDQILVGTTAGLSIYSETGHGFQPPLELGLMGKAILNIIPEGKKILFQDPDGLSAVTAEGLQRIPFPRGISLESKYQPILNGPNRLIYVLPGGEVLEMDKGRSEFRKVIGRPSSVASLSDFTCLEHDPTRGSLRLGTRSGAVVEYDLGVRSWSTLLARNEERGGLVETLPVGNGIVYRTEKGEVAFAKESRTHRFIGPGRWNVEDSALLGGAEYGGSALAYTAGEWAVYNVDRRDWSAARSLPQQEGDIPVDAGYGPAGPIFLTRDGTLFSPAQVLSRGVNELSMEGDEVWIRRGNEVYRLSSSGAFKKRLGGGSVRLLPDENLFDALELEGKIYLLSPYRILSYDLVHHSWAEERTPAPLVELHSSQRAIWGKTAGGEWYRRMQKGVFRHEGTYPRAAVAGGLLAAIDGDSLLVGRVEYFGRNAPRGDSGDILAVGRSTTWLCLFLPEGIALYNPEQRRWKLPLVPYNDPGKMRSAVVDGGKVYLVSGDGDLYQLDLESLSAGRISPRPVIRSQGPAGMKYPFTDGVRHQGRYFVASGNQLSIYDPASRSWQLRGLMAPAPIARLIPVGSEMHLLLQDGQILRWLGVSGQARNAFTLVGSIPASAVTRARIGGGGKIIWIDQTGDRQPSLCAKEIGRDSLSYAGFFGFAEGLRELRFLEGQCFVLTRKGVSRFDASTRPLNLPTPDLPGNYISLSHDLDPRSGRPTLRVNRTDGTSIYYQDGKWEEGKDGRGEREIRYQDRYWQWIRGEGSLSIATAEGRVLPGFQLFDSATGTWAFDRCEEVALVEDQLWTLSGGVAYRQLRSPMGTAGGFEFHVFPEALTTLAVVGAAPGKELWVRDRKGHHYVRRDGEWVGAEPPPEFAARILHQTRYWRWTREDGKTRLHWTGSGVPFEVPISRDGHLEFGFDSLQDLCSNGEDLFIATRAGIARFPDLSGDVALDSMELWGAPSGRGEFVNVSRPAGEIFFRKGNEYWHWTGKEWSSRELPREPGRQIVVEKPGFVIWRDERGLHSSVRGKGDEGAGAGGGGEIFLQSRGFLSFVFDEISAIHVERGRLYARLPGAVLEGRIFQGRLEDELMRSLPGSGGEFRSLRGFIPDPGLVWVAGSGEIHRLTPSGDWERFQPPAESFLDLSRIRVVLLRGSWLWIEEEVRDSHRLRKFHRTNRGGWEEVKMQNGALQTDRVHSLVWHEEKLWADTDAGVLEIFRDAGGFRFLLDPSPPRSGTARGGLLFTHAGKLYRRGGAGRFSLRSGDGWEPVRDEAAGKGFQEAVAAREGYHTERLWFDLKESPPARILDRNGDWVEMAWRDGRWGKDALLREGSVDERGIWLLSAQGVSRLPVGASWESAELYPGSLGVERIERVGDRSLALRGGKIFELDEYRGLVPLDLPPEERDEALVRLTRRVLVPSNGFWTWWLEREGGSLHVEVVGAAEPFEAGLEGGGFPFDRIRAISSREDEKDGVVLATDGGICDGEPTGEGGIRYRRIAPAWKGVLELLATREGIYGRTGQKGNQVVFRESGQDRWISTGESPFHRRLLASRGNLRWVAVEQALDGPGAGNLGLEVEARSRLEGRWISFREEKGRWPYCTLYDLAAQGDHAWISTGVGLARVSLLEGKISPPESWEYAPRFNENVRIFTQDLEGAALTVVENSGREVRLDPQGWTVSDLGPAERAGRFLFRTGEWDWVRTVRGVRCFWQKDPRRERSFLNGCFEDELVLGISLEGSKLWALTRGGFISFEIDPRTLKPAGRPLSFIPEPEWRERTGVPLSRVEPGRSDLIPADGGLLVAVQERLVQVRETKEGGEIEMVSILELPGDASYRFLRDRKGMVLRVKSRSGGPLKFHRIQTNPLRLEPWELEFGAESRRFRPWGEREMPGVVLLQKTSGLFSLQRSGGEGRQLDLPGNIFFVAEGDESLWCAGPEGLTRISKESASRRTGR